MRKVLCLIMVISLLSACFSVPFKAADDTPDDTFAVAGTGAMTGYAGTGAVFESASTGAEPVYLYKKIEDTSYVEIVGIRNCPEVLVIPEKVDGYTVRVLGVDAFSGETALREVTLPGTLGKKGMYDSVFANCTNLTTVTFSEGIVAVGVRAFSGCSSLKKVDLPDSLLSIYTNAFYSCTSLESLRIPESVSYISDSAFYFCKAMKSFVVDAENEHFYVKDGMLLSKSIIELEDKIYHYSDEMIAYPEARGSYFAVPDYVESIGKALCYNSTIEELSFPDKISSYSFMGCKNLKKVEIRGTGGSFKVGYEAFRDCTSIEELRLPENTSAIGDRAFHGCIGLKKINIPDNVTKIGSLAFYNCAGLKHIAIGSGTKIIGEKAFKECTGLESVIFGQSVESVEDSAFEGCTALDTVVFNEGLKMIKHDAFLDCPSLHMVYIPKSLDFLEYSSHPALGFYDGGYSVYQKNSDFCIYSYLNTRAYTYASKKKIPFYAVSVPDSFLPESSQLVMTVGDSAKPEFIVSPGSLSDYPIMYTSDDYDVAQVGADGTVTAVSTGSAVITAHAPEGKTASFAVTVKAVPEPTEPPTDPPAGSDDALTLTLDHHPDKETVLIGDELIYGCFLNASIAYRDDDKAKGVINAVSAYVHYDKTKLELISGPDDMEYCFPVLGNSTYTKMTDYGLWFSAYDKDGYYFDNEDALLVRLRFKVIGSGESEIETLPYRAYTYSSSGDVSYLVDDYKYTRCDVAKYYNVFMTGYSLRLPLGDVDGDREVTILDANYIQRIAAGVDVPDDLFRKFSDTDGDGSITLMDATYIQRWLSGLSSNSRIGVRY